MSNSTEPPPGRQRDRKLFTPIIYNTFGKIKKVHSYEKWKNNKGCVLAYNLKVLVLPYKPIKSYLNSKRKLINLFIILFYLIDLAYNKINQ